MHINTSWRSNKRKMKDEVKNAVYASYKDKFMALLVKPGEDECWYIDIGGAEEPLNKYCSFGWKAPEDRKNTIYMARKVAYEVFFGPLDDGVFITSICRKPGCLNPKHLIAGTKSQTLKTIYKDKDHEKD